jgi:hypothetical protein
MKHKTVKKIIWLILVAILVMSLVVWLGGPLFGIY